MGRTVCTCNRYRSSTARAGTKGDIFFDTIELGSVIKFAIVLTYVCSVAGLNFRSRNFQTDLLEKGRHWTIDIRHELVYWLVSISRLL